MRPTPARAPDEIRAYVTAPGFEEALLAEMNVPVAAKGPRWPGVVSVAGGQGGAPIDPVFARQVLPAARIVKGETVQALAGGVHDAVRDEIKNARAFTWHVFVPDAHAYRNIRSHAVLVEKALAEMLAPHRPAASTPPDGLLVQVAVVGRSSVLVSAAMPRALPRGGYDIAPWPAGIAPVPDDRTAPSRAYRKLRESFAWLGAAPAPGETCVDLGAAPGGWTWTALQTGAHVIAVDRAPVEAPAAGHRRLTMITGTAFTYVPKAPIDWLLCDVICEPARTAELVFRWMQRGLCRKAVATLKFKGPWGYGILPDIRRQLEAANWRLVRLKHLFHHHNEVAILALRNG